MKSSIYQELTNLFPISPSDAQGSLPKELKTGKILTYTAQVTRDLMYAICVLFTGEDPLNTKRKDPQFSNWKNQIQYDQEGNKIRLTCEDGTESKEFYRRWEPVQFIKNRNATPTHFKLLANRFARTGYISSLRKIVIGSDGHLLDGQHSLLALWYYFEENPEVETVDVSVEINSKDNPAKLFRLFDQAQRKRTLKDALTTLGIEGFEADLAGTLRFVTLLSTGKELNQSRLALPHIVCERGKLVNLQADDIASLIEAGGCFEYVKEDLFPLLSETITTVDPESGDEDEVSLLSVPQLTGPGMPNAQYWMTAYLNAKYDLRDGDSVTLEHYVKFLTLVAEGDDEEPSVIKLRGFKPAKAIDWLPAIEHCFNAWLTSSDLKRSMPKTLTFNGIQAQYDAFLDSFNDTPADDETQEDNDQEETVEE